MPEHTTFEDFLQAIEGLDDEGHDMTLEWGESQGFERFKLSLANKRLSHWQDWARTDASEIPRQAQMRAFGKVIAQLGRRGLGQRANTKAPLMEPCVHSHVHVFMLKSIANACICLRTLVYFMATDARERGDSTWQTRAPCTHASTAA